MKHNLKNMIRLKLSVVMLLCAMLTVSNAAWGSYYIVGSGITGLGWGPGTKMTSDTYENTANTTGTAYIGIYSQSDVGSSDKCYYITYDKTVAISLGTSYTIRHGGYGRMSFSVVSGTTYNISISDGKLTVTSVCSGNTVNSSVSAHGSITPNGSSCVTSSKEYSVHLDAHYKVSSVSNTTGGTLSPTASELVNSTGDFTVTLSSPSTSGNLTINTTACETYSVTVTATGGTVSPTGAQTIYEGDSKNFTVTPTTGYVYKGYTPGDSFDGTVSKSDNTFTVTPTHGGTISISYGLPGSDIPVVRIGNKIGQDISSNVIVSAYLTSEKCYNVDEIVVYYANNSAFRTEGSMVTLTKSFTSGSPYALNSTHSLTLTANEVSSIVGNGETLYVRMKAHNTNGYSAYSDVVSLVYANEDFIAVDQEKFDADACDGNHEFTWSDMFTPTPAFEDCSVIDDASGKSAKDQFTLTSDGKMVWNVIESVDEDGTVNIKPNGTYVFTFTAKKTGYTPANAEFTIHLSTTGTEEVIDGIFLNGSDVPITEYGDLTPWMSATLSTDDPDPSGDVEKIGWSVTPDNGNYIMSAFEGTSVDFKGRTVGEFVVTARGLTETCGSSPSKTITITVNADSEPCD